MRVLQPLLLIAGSTALGAVSSTVLIYAAMRVLLRDPGEDHDYGPAVALLGLLTCGGVLGAIAGFITSLRWSAALNQHTWPPVVWLGIALGTAAGIPLCLAAPNHNPFWLTFIHDSLLTAASATAGGFLAAAASSRRKRHADKLHHRGPSPEGV